MGRFFHKQPLVMTGKTDIRRSEKFLVLADMRVVAASAHASSYRHMNIFGPGKLFRVMAHQAQVGPF